MNEQIEKLPLCWDDGGRKLAGFQGTTSDCVVRAISIVANRPYALVYSEINDYAKSERRGSRKRGISSARLGVYKDTIRKYLADLGFKWTPTMQIGSGCKVHLRKGELPQGELIVSLSKHLTAVINGIIHDTHDPSRGGTRCVYGYWKRTEVK